MSPFSRKEPQCACKHKRYQCLNIDLLASSLGSLVAHNQAVVVSTFVRHNSKLTWAVHRGVMVLIKWCLWNSSIIAESELRCVYKQIQAIHSRAARAWSWRLLRWLNDRSCWIRLWTKQNYINELKSWIFRFNGTRSLDTFKVVLEWTYLLSRFRCWRQCRS